MGILFPLAGLIAYAPIETPVFSFAVDVRSISVKEFVKNKIYNIVAK